VAEHHLTRDAEAGDEVLLRGRHGTYVCVCVCVCVNEADKAQSSRWKRVGFVRDVFLLGEKARVDMRSGGVGGGGV